MIGKWIVRGAVAVVGLALVGGLLFGDELVSYAKSSLNLMHGRVKGAVPIEFELTRARDLLDEIIPEMQANIQRIATEEVELAALKQDIAQSTEQQTQERARISKLRDTVDVVQTSYHVGGRQYSRQQVVDDLSHRFELLKEAEVVLAGKQRLLEQREQTLAAAEQMLDKTRSQKALLEDKIETLTSQYRLVQAASVGSSVQLDNSKLAQTEKLIDQIKKRLDVAERVLARESDFVQPIEVSVVDEADLLAQVDEYLHGPVEQPTAATADAGQTSDNPVETR
ncbi:MAG: signal peptide-containing protein [Phycisphaeraceae bacterium]|nr:signal peptide-containing protein [Phycisphaeraceae bacterium]